MLLRRRTTRLRFGWAHGLGLLVFLCLTLLFRIIDPGPLEFLRLKYFDFLQSVMPRTAPADSPVTIVDIDEKSLTALGQWPWPRARMGEILDRLTDYNARVVGYDVIFAEPQRYNTDTQSAADSDLAFADAIRRSGRVVLGNAANAQITHNNRVGPARVGFAAPPDAPGKGPEWLPPNRYVTHNVTMFEGPASGAGMLTTGRDQDELVRRLPVAYNGGGFIYPAFSLELLRVNARKSAAILTVNRAGLSHATIPDVPAIPLDQHGGIWPYFAKSDLTKYVSAVDLLNGAVDPKRFDGKIVLIGTSAPGLGDIRAAPANRTIPGVELHAQAVESVLAGMALRRWNYANAAELLMFAAAAIVLIVALLVSPFSLSLPILVGLIALNFGFSAWLYAAHHVLLDASFVAVFLSVLWIVTVYMAQRRQAL